MPSSLLYPPNLPQPLASGAPSTFENTRSEFESEMGLSRRRQKYRTTPRVFDCSIVMSQDDYHIFDNWFEYGIFGGLNEFDIRLIDGSESVLSWFTVRFVDEYEATCNPQMQWEVKFKLRTIQASFQNRISGTNEMHGYQDVQASNTGALLVIKALYGRQDVSIDNYAVMSINSLRGLCDAIMYNSGRMFVGQNLISNLIIRQWYGVIGFERTFDDQFDEHIRREFGGF